MFEMKNEEDGSVRRKRNVDHLSKLDKDRRNKGCEYAVLVSLLEPESDLYNQGIVDVSYEFEKMYVIRPQFFIPMITILRNAALNAAGARRELAEMRRQDIDVTNFETALDDFKTRFANNYGIASKKFSVAVDEIDKTIDHLQKVKENLISSDRQLRLANEKADALTIRRLTNKNATMLTGDQVRTAQVIADQVGVDEVVAGVMPEQKERKVRELQSAGGRVAMGTRAVVRDGVKPAQHLVGNLEPIRDCG